MLSYLLAALESEEDKRRFTELYEENHVRAEQTALRILRDPHDAEDAVQNAFLQVIHHFNEISEIPCKKLGFWIISIVKNEALMILRRKQKELPQEDWDTFSRCELFRRLYACAYPQGFFRRYSLGHLSAHTSLPILWRQAHRHQNRQARLCMPRRMCTFCVTWCFM